MGKKKIPIPPGHKSTNTVIKTLPDLSILLWTDPQKSALENRKEYWRLIGARIDSNVRGSALNLLYSSDRFKGKNIDGKGNPNVGGSLETPSFVWIKSIFPASNSSVSSGNNLWSQPSRSQNLC